MDKVSELRCILGESFTWHKARLDCFIQIIIGLFSVRTVNLKEIALSMVGKAQVDSHYRRLQRFFSHFEIDYTIIACWIFRLFFHEGDKLYLSLDRTNWFWGKAPINALVLSIAYEGVAIPVFWRLLPKAGNSNTQERIDILQRFVGCFGAECIEALLADREFIGEKWFAWLTSNKIPFCIRIKENFDISVIAGKGKPAKWLFRDLNPKTQRLYENYVLVLKNKLRIAAGRSETGELLIVVTNYPCRNPVAVYLRRWEIETLFAALKTHGFRFEETHITEPKRIERLMAVLAVGFAWAHKVGEWRAEKKAIILKKHKDKTIRPQYTYFRYGFDYIREATLNIQQKWGQFKRAVGIISLHCATGEGTL